MEIQLLGPVELWSDDRRVPLALAQVRKFTAILALSANRPVAYETIGMRLWDGEPPPHARTTIHSYASRLRHALHQAQPPVGGQIELTYDAGAYCLRIDPDSVDVLSFRRLVHEARRAASAREDHGASELYRVADALWRAEPLAGIKGEWADLIRSGLHEERRVASAARIDAELRQGRHAAVLGEVIEALAENAYDEHAVGQLMVIHYRSGRQADSLDVFQRARDRLRKDLGIEPGKELASLHHQILNRAPELFVEPPPPGPAARPPNTLLRMITTFTARTEEIQRITERLTHGDHVVLSGMPGVGKTALAMHVAHRITASFPDGQLYVNLHGHTPGVRPLEPFAALATLLNIIGVPAERYPATLDERAALWRARIADRRLLVVLDNAASHEQVEPLLPGTSQSAVIITSRRRLGGLDNFHNMTLDVLSADDAAILLTRITERDVPSTDAELRSIVELCGRLPLALQLIGGRLQHHRSWGLSDMSRRLGYSRRRLDEIHVADVDIKTAFDVSYRELSGDQQILFRRLGLHPGPDICPHAAAALLGASVVSAERILDGLVEHHLLEEPASGLYQLHDLLRDYARNLAERHETSTGQIRGRLFEFYLAAIEDAHYVLFSPDTNSPSSGEASGDRRFRLDDAKTAADWLGDELNNIVAIIRSLAQDGHDGDVIRAAQLLRPFFENRGEWEQGIVVHSLALDACRRQEDDSATAETALALGKLCLRTGRYSQATRSLDEAQRIRSEAGDEAGRADTLDLLGQSRWHQGSYEDALSLYNKALLIRHAIGNKSGVAEMLNHIGILMWHLGRYEEALQYFRQALEIYRSVENETGEALTLNNMAGVHERLGQLAEAQANYHTVAGIMETRGTTRQWWAILLANMARINQRSQRFDEAWRGYQEALEIFREINDRGCLADIHNSIATLRREIGESVAALENHEIALAIATDIIEPHQQVRAMHGIGLVHLDTGRNDEALGEFRQALAAAREIGDPYEVARSLDGMAAVFAASDDVDGAREYWRQALAIFDRLGVPEAADVRSRLRSHIVD